MSRFENILNSEDRRFKKNAGSYYPLYPGKKYAGANENDSTAETNLEKKNPGVSTKDSNSGNNNKGGYDGPPGGNLSRPKTDRQRAEETSWVSHGCWALIAVIVFAMGVTALILSSIAVSRIDDNEDALIQIRDGIMDHRNATLRMARYLSTVMTLNDLHTQEFLCAILVTECFNLQTNAAPAQIGYGALGHICKQIEETCVSIVKNQVDVLNEWDITPGTDYAINSELILTVPDQFIFGSTALNGIRFDRLGPSSAQFGGLVQDVEKPLFDKNEYGMFIAFSYTDVPGTDGLTDGLCWINLEVSSDTFGTCTVLLDTGVKGGVYQVFANQNRVFAIGTAANAIYWWDTSTSVALSSAGTTITSANIVAGTYTAANATVLRSPWHMEEFDNGDYLVSMLDSNATNCTVTTPYLCGGFMRIDATLLPTNPAGAVSRWDSQVDGFEQTRHTPGEFAMGDGARRAVVAGSFGSWLITIDPNCFNLSTQVLTGPPVWGRQYNIYDSSNGQIVKQAETGWPTISDLIPIQNPRPFEEWRNSSGFIPNIVRAYHKKDTRYLIADTVGGAIVSVNYAGTSAADPWTDVIMTWVLPFVNPSIPLDQSAWRSPLLTDMAISNDDQYMYIALYGLGQIQVYYLGDTGDSLTSNGIPEHCASYQITGGQGIFGGTFTHSANPTIPLQGAPASLTLEPNGKFLYVSTSHPFDECVYPNAISSGGFVFRFTIHADVCNSQSLNIDPSFLLRGSNLPGGRQGFPARMNKMVFPAGDSKFKRVVRQLGGTP